jgi:hypothetical protein
MLGLLCGIYVLTEALWSTALLSGPLLELLGQ